MLIYFIFYFNSTRVKASPPSEASAGPHFFTNWRSDLSQLRIFVLRMPFVPCPCKIYTTGRPAMRHVLNLSFDISFASSRLQPRTSTVLTWVRMFPLLADDDFFPPPVTAWLLIDDQSSSPCELAWRFSALIAFSAALEVDFFPTPTVWPSVRW